VVDGSTFVALFELADGTEDQRPAIPEYGQFLEQLRSWVERAAGDRASRRGGIVQPLRRGALDRQ
jgi:hypothetical protein